MGFRVDQGLANLDGCRQKWHSLELSNLGINIKTLSYFSASWELFLFSDRKRALNSARIDPFLIFLEKSKTNKTQPVTPLPPMSSGAAVPPTFLRSVWHSELPSQQTGLFISSCSESKRITRSVHLSGVWGPGANSQKSWPLLQKPLN